MSTPCTMATSFWRMRSGSTEVMSLYLHFINTKQSPGELRELGNYLIKFLCHAHPCHRIQVHDIDTGKIDIGAEQPPTAMLEPGSFTHGIDVCDRFSHLHVGKPWSLAMQIEFLNSDQRQ